MALIELSDEVLRLLGSRAEPFVDTTPEAVIRKLLASTAATSEPMSSPSVQTFPASTPPNLAFTKVSLVRISGDVLPPEETYWNHVIFALARRAGQQGKSPEEIRDRLRINAVLGEKADQGYRFVSEAGVSFQGQDANGAWKAIRSLAQYLKLSVELTFEWLDNPKADNPGRTAKLVV